ncbi:MAG: sensor histidine kinase [Flavobacteriales bacterium]|nr:sensor histidine kinase [Flavobacteriales bacterium]
MVASKIIEHLVNIAKGECCITEASILKIENKEDQTIELGLLTLFEEIEFNKKKLEKSNQEKDLLLKEIHHRVKNNLQIISSLLTLPRFYSDNEESTAILRDCRSRVITMSIIHEKLYRSKNFSNVDYEDYLIELISQLKISHSFAPEDLHFKISVPPIKLDLDTAVPLSLLINEIFTNSIKYGLNDHNKSEIYLQIREIRPHYYKMKIGDNGLGYANEIFDNGQSTLGIQLIRDLTDQLNGKIEMINDPAREGAHYLIEFEEV